MAEEKATYEQYVSTCGLERYLESVPGSSPVVVDHIDRWGYEESRMVVSIGSMRDDDGNRYLVLYTMEGRPKSEPRAGGKSDE